MSVVIGTPGAGDTPPGLLMAISGTSGGWTGNLKMPGFAWAVNAAFPETATKRRGKAMHSNPQG